MHYCGVVFSAPGADLEEVMEPHREYYDEAGKTGYWDCWAEGGRWAYAEDELLSGAREPYFFLTLDGEWIEREEFIPEGYSDEEFGYGDPKKSYFKKVEDFSDRYHEYRLSVPAGTVVTVVDIHS